VTALEGVDVLLGEAPVEEELAGRLRLRGLQLLTVELVGRLVRVDEAFAGARFFTTRPRRPTLVVDRVPDLLGDRLHRLREGDVLHLHEEGEDVTTLARGEAVEVPAVRTDVERRGALVLERTQTLERVVPARLELDILADDLLDRRALTDRLNIRI